MLLRYLLVSWGPDHFVTELSVVNASICDTLDKAVFFTIVHRRQQLGVAIRHLAPKFDT